MILEYGSYQISKDTITHISKEASLRINRQLSEGESTPEEDVTGDTTITALQNEYTLKSGDIVAPGKIVLTKDVVVDGTGRLSLQVSKASDILGTQVITVKPGGSIKIGAGIEAVVLEGTIYKLITN